MPTHMRAGQNFLKRGGGPRAWGGGGLCEGGTPSPKETLSFCEAFFFTQNG